MSASQKIKMTSCPVVVYTLESICFRQNPFIPSLPTRNLDFISFSLIYPFFADH